MTWPASCPAPWSPPTYRCGSATATEGGYRKLHRHRQARPGAASPIQLFPDQTLSRPPYDQRSLSAVAVLKVLRLGLHLNEFDECLRTGEVAGVGGVQRQGVAGRSGSDHEI